MSAANTNPGAPKTAGAAVEGVDLSEKIFLVTGAYSGLGAATTKALLKAGAKVIVAGRNRKSQDAFAATLTKLQRADGQSVASSQIDASHVLDLGDLASVRDFSVYVEETYDWIDCLINNAGIMNTPAGTTKDGFEVQFGTNVIGHFLLAKRLAGITTRQVWLSSEGHKRANAAAVEHDGQNAPRLDLDAVTNVDHDSYQGWMRYQQSKLGDVLLAKQFPLEFSHINACSVHPGLVMTNLGRHTSTWMKLKFVLAGLFGKVPPMAGPEEGARTQTLCAVMPDEDLVTGAYYASCAVAEEAQSAKNMDDARKLFAYCDDVTAPFQA